MRDLETTFISKADPESTTKRKMMQIKPCTRVNYSIDIPGAFLHRLYIIVDIITIVAPE